LRELLIPQRQNLEKRQGFLGLFESDDVLKDGLGFPILGDDQRLLLPPKVVENLRGIGLQIADRLDSH